MNEKMARAFYTSKKKRNTRIFSTFVTPTIANNAWEFFIGNSAIVPKSKKLWFFQHKKIGSRLAFVALRAHSALVHWTNLSYKEVSILLNFG